MAETLSKEVGLNTLGTKEKKENFSAISDLDYKKRQNIVGLKRDFVGIKEIFEKAKFIQEQKKEGIIITKEDFGLSNDLLLQKQQLTEQIKSKIENSGMSKEEARKLLFEIAYDFLPDWWEYPLYFIVGAEEIPIINRMKKVIEAAVKFEKNYDKLRPLLKDEKTFIYVEKIVETIKRMKPEELPNLNEKLDFIIKQLRGILTKNSQYKKNAELLAKEIETLKTDVSIAEKEIKTIGVVKKEEKVITETVQNTEKSIETEGKIEAFSRLKDNLNPYFGKGKNKYSEVRENVLKEVEKFKTRNGIKNNPDEVEKYLDEFKDLIKSHNKNPGNINTIEDAINFLKINH